MIAEQDVSRLKEVKRRMELLIDYYRGLGEKERAFAQDLEVRLRGVATKLGAGTESSYC